MREREREVERDTEREVERHRERETERESEGARDCLGAKERERVTELEGRRDGAKTEEHQLGLRGDDGAWIERKICMVGNESLPSISLISLKKLTKSCYGAF